MTEDDGLRGGLREFAKALATFALVIAIDLLRGGDGMDSDFPVLLAEFLLAAALVDLLARGYRRLRRTGRARRTGGRPGRADPRRPGAVRSALLIVLAGLPVLVGLLLLGARLASDGWASAVERTVASPYSWIVGLVYLSYALTATPPERRGRRRRPALRFVSDLAFGLLAIGVISADVAPDRWYGTLAEILLAVFGASGLANVAQQIFGEPGAVDQEAGAMPIGPSRGPSSLAG